MLLLSLLLNLCALYGASTPAAHEFNEKLLLNERGVPWYIEVVPQLKDESWGDYLSRLIKAEIVIKDSKLLKELGQTLEKNYPEWFFYYAVNSVGYLKVREALDRSLGRFLGKHQLLDLDANVECEACPSVPASE